MLKLVPIKLPKRSNHAVPHLSPDWVMLLRTDPSQMLDNTLAIDLLDDRLARTELSFLALQHKLDDRLAQTETTFFVMLQDRLDRTCQLIVSIHEMCGQHISDGLSEVKTHHTKIMKQLLDHQIRLNALDDQFSARAQPPFWRRLSESDVCRCP